MKKYIVVIIAVILFSIIAGFLYEAIKYSGMKKECVARLSSLESAREMSIYLKPTADQNAQKFIEKIRSIGGIKNIRHVSSEQGLEEFKEKYKDSPLLTQSLESLKAHPLHASISIEFESIADANDTSKDVFFENAALASGIGIAKITRAGNIVKQLQQINSISSFVGITSLWNQGDELRKLLLQECVNSPIK